MHACAVVAALSVGNLSSWESLDDEARGRKKQCRLKIGKGPGLALGKLLMMRLCSSNHDSTPRVRASMTGDARHSGGGSRSSSGSSSVSPRQAGADQS